MSLLLWLIAIFALLIILGLVMRVVGGIAALILGLGVIAFIVVGLIWIITDVNDLRNHFYQDEKLFLLDVDGRLIAGFTMGGDGVPKVLANVTPMRFDYPNLQKLRGNYYKVIVFDWEAIADDLGLMGFTATDDELRAALTSDTPKRLAVDKLAEKYLPNLLPQVRKEVDRIYPTQDQFRGTIFLLLAMGTLNDPDLFIEGMQKEVIVVYPETVTFKLLKMLPMGLRGALLPPQQKEVDYGPAGQADVLEA
jgi:hypothetical protein